MLCNRHSFDCATPVAFLLKSRQKEDLVDLTDSTQQMAIKPV